MPLKDPEARRAYDRMRHQRDRLARSAHNAEYKKRRRATDPEFAERERERCRAFPKYAKHAHTLVRVALKRGDLVRPDVCEECSGNAYCEAAHSDYSKPLDIRWLCRPCHRRWDRLEPKVAA